MSSRRSNAESGRGRTRRLRGRDSYAWWEYAIMAVVGVLILGGAVLLIRMLLSGGEPTSSTSTPVPSFTPACAADEWPDPATGECAPRVECAAPLVYDEATNTCLQGPPAVAGVSPQQGPAAGGTELTITGSGFQPGATVSINGVPGEGTRVEDDGTIVTRTPPGTVYYAVDVVVTNPDGQSDVLDNIFTYAEPPIEYLTEVIPDTGSTSGGEAVILKGRDFADGTVVSFKGRPARNVIVLNAETIRATIPASSAGTVNVNVRIPGRNPYTLENGFTYARQAPRRVTQVRPNEGPIAGNTRVTVAGSGFTSGATVTFGGKKARRVTVVDSTRITAFTPPGNLGQVAVAVRLPGLPAAILDKGFSYVEAPTITGVTPAELPTTGRKRITVTGTGFLDGAEVTVGGAPATRIRVVDDTTIRAVAPAGELGPAPVVVTNPGQPAAVLKRAVTYVEAPPKPEPTPTPTATPTVARCPSYTLPPATTPLGSDLILTDADLFPASVRSPRLTAAGLTGPSGSGSIDWKPSPPRIVWRTPVAGTVSASISFSYQAASCEGLGTGTISVRAN